MDVSADETSIALKTKTYQNSSPSRSSRSACCDAMVQLRNACCCEHTCHTARLCRDQRQGAKVKLRSARDCEHANSSSQQQRRHDQVPCRTNSCATCVEHWEKGLICFRAAASQSPHQNLLADCNPHINTCQPLAVYGLDLLGARPTCALSDGNDAMAKLRSARCCERQRERGLLFQANIGTCSQAVVTSLNPFATTARTPWASTNSHVAVSTKSCQVHSSRKNE